MGNKIGLKKLLKRVENDTFECGARNVERGKEKGKRTKRTAGTNWMYPTNAKRFRFVETREKLVLTLALTPAVSPERGGNCSSVGWQFTS